MEVFKARLDGALGSLVWWLVALPVAGEGGWNLMILGVPSKPFYDSMKPLLCTPLCKFLG